MLSKGNMARLGWYFVRLLFILSHSNHMAVWSLINYNISPSVSFHPCLGPGQ